MYMKIAERSLGSWDEESGERKKYGGDPGFPGEPVCRNAMLTCQFRDGLHIVQWRIRSPFLLAYLPFTYRGLGCRVKSGTPIPGREVVVFK